MTGSQPPSPISSSILLGLVLPWLALSISSCQSNAVAPPDSRMDEAAELFESSCRLCHGTAEMQRGPIIDGLPAWYVEEQLRKFQTGIRGQNPANRSEYLMGTATNLYAKPELIPAMARYVESLPPKPYLKTIRGDVEKGRTVFMLCAVCHGPEARGNPELKSPPLIFQEDWYRFDQLYKFREKLRGSHADDLAGQQMQAAVQALNIADLRNVVAYITEALSTNTTPTNSRP